MLISAIKDRAPETRPRPSPRAACLKAPMTKDAGDRAWIGPWWTVDRGAEIAFRPSLGDAPAYRVHPPVVSEDGGVMVPVAPKRARPGRLSRGEEKFVARWLAPFEVLKTIHCRLMKELDFSLGPRRFYTPTFAVFHHDVLSLVAVHGLRGDARIAGLAAASRLYPCFEWLLVNGRNGDYRFREVVAGEVGPEALCPWHDAPLRGL